MAIILRFSKPWLNKTSPITLRFVESGNDVPVRVPITIPVDIVVDFNVSEIVIDRTFGIEIGVSWFALDAVEQALMLAESAYDIESKTESPWLSYNADETDISSAWSSNIANDSTLSIAWLFNPDIRTDTSINWSLPIDHQVTLSVNWVVPDEHQIQSSINWLDISAHQLQTAVAWIDGQDQESPLIIQYRGIVVDDEKSIKWGFHEPRWVCSTKYRPPVGKLTLRFNEPLSTQQNPIFLRLTASPNYCYWDDGGGLIDANPPLPTIDFKIPIEPQIRRSYLMQPQISCVRVSDGVAVVLKSVSISQSRSQWASSGSLAFSSRIDAERAANELLKISINGYDFYLLCESPSESKAFGKTSYSATGRGRLATLASPNRKAINYVNVVARSFIGLMADIVANTGWTVASKISDYPVPANAFSYAAKTPAEAINMMANSIGAMLDVNDETQTITVIPQWPVVPWNTASAIPDVILHDGVILEFNERIDIRPDANAVFVRGEQQGVAAKVKRFGTAGDNFAADIVDKLITDNQAARMRATAELANAGNKVQNSIRAKVMADLPPMRPGMLIGVRKGAEVFKSVCESFSISGSVNESTGMVTVNQTVTLLRNEVAA
ncbi:hypothetical protein KV201_03750 [Shewanella sp. SR1]|uniref:hypothetical protein n=2 Tax=unclassified Shewanella TaxID=196818 RepID=UPI001CF2D816|nr:hypothetical protein [Shewanella sp. SR1]MCB2381291.1 hypothetical protein [Shewanella sp. SR1]